MKMDVSDKFVEEKRNEDFINYHSHNRPSNWQFGSTSFENNPLGLIPNGDPTEICNQDLIDNSWDHPLNSQNFGFGENVQNITRRLCNSIGNEKVGDGALRTGHDQTLDIGWNQQSSILNRGLSFPNVHEMIPHSLSQFPTDSGFIERAAKFSCFNGDSFSDMVNSFSIPESASPRYQKNELHMEEILKDSTLLVKTEATEVNLHKNERGKVVLRSPDEAKECVGVSNGSDEAELSGDDMVGKPYETEVDFKNRKRSGQATELDQVRSVKPHLVEAEKDYTKIQHGDRNSPNTNTRKHSKQKSQPSNPPKDEYTHVRARRGQATNSHSLAERARRGKITEREKLLQDLVPGCSKVTGKAVMLDEIIQYVQSLQRQVEFLSMKLARVDPWLDFNIKDLLSKATLQARARPPSTSEFSRAVNMPYPQVHPPGAVNPDMGNYYDTFRDTMSTQLKTLNDGYKGSSPMIPNAWEDELPNVVQMRLGPGISSETQDLNGIRF